MSIININIKHDFNSDNKFSKIKLKNVIEKQYDIKYSKFLEKKQILDNTILSNTSNMNINDINKLKEKISNNNNILLNIKN